jgi:hypothetical protein
MNELRTCFKRVDYDLSSLLQYIEIGDIGLPDIQRPFVWANTKVRDLFDSMYKGFPVGYLLFWENSTSDNVKQIGINEKTHKTPARLIVDGQQRLTSLYSVFKNKKVFDENYRERSIEIAFRPRDGKFEVADAATRQDPEFIPNISELWSSNKSSRKLVNDFLQNLGATKHLSEEEEEAIAHNLDRLFDLQKYPFTALEIAPNVDEEQVADIFVRINSEGVKLQQADFILTLLSVFWEKGRHDLERFCRAAKEVPRNQEPSPFNYIIQPAPDQLLRVSVALGFFRGRLKNVYQLLRGKNLKTGVFSSAERDEQFKILENAQTHVLNLRYWHQFLSSIIGAGFRSSELISSENALLYAYALYLIGHVRFQAPEHALQRLMGRWFWMTHLTSRYSGAFESTIEQDLAKLRDIEHAEQYLEILERIVNDELTSDFWQITLPNDLDTSASTNPAVLAYYAALNRLNAPVLFSTKRVSDLLDPSLKTKRKSLERHHLFPKAYLESVGISEQKQTNQAANMALLEWPDNNAIKDTPPSSYVSKLQSRFSSEVWNTMYQLHGLPQSWETLDYSDFLEKRRVLLASVIKQGFDSLA